MMTWASVAHALASAQGVPESVVYLLLQHVLDVFGAVVLKTVEAQLFAGLLASDELPLDAQPTISHLLPAVVAHLLLPYALPPKSKQPYFF